MNRYAIKVVWRDGTEEYVCRGVCGGAIATFPNKERAQEHADFLGEGLDEAQSINVVLAPKVRP